MRYVKETVEKVPQNGGWAALSQLMGIKTAHLL